MNKNLSGFGKLNWLFILIIAASLAFWLISSARSANNMGAEVSYSEFLLKVDNKAVSEVTIEGDKCLFTDTVGDRFYTYLPGNTALVDNLRVKHPDLTVAVIPANKVGWIAMIISLLPTLLILGSLLYMGYFLHSGMRRATGAHGNFAPVPIKSTTTFDDIGGVDECKAELLDIVDFLQNSAKYEKLSARTPKGVLLVGAPGTGKTLVAKAVAGEAGVPFFGVCGSEFVEMFVGTGAGRMRSLFNAAAAYAKSVIFIDEIDTIGHKRGSYIGGAHQEGEQTMTQLLTFMDGLVPNSVLVIAATNREDVLDEALTRPGRFDRTVQFPMPDTAGRLAILKIKVRGKPIAKNVSLDVVARGTTNFSGAHLDSLVNEAAIKAARDGGIKITMQDFEYAKDKMLMGPERSSLQVIEDDRKCTAYHEAGHGLVAILLEPLAEAVHKISIVPGINGSLGRVVQLPKSEILLMGKDKLKVRLAVALGGRMAEKIIFGEDRVTTGAAADFVMVTEISTRMVTEWGMSDTLGGVVYPYNTKSIWGQVAFSDETKKLIDKEVRDLSAEASKKAESLLLDNIEDLHLLASTLLERENLTGQEVHELLKTRKIPKNTTTGDSAIPIDNGGETVF